MVHGVGRPIHTRTRKPCKNGKLSIQAKAGKCQAARSDAPIACSANCPCSRKTNIELRYLLRRAPGRGKGSALRRSRGRRTQNIICASHTVARLENFSDICKGAGGAKASDKTKLMARSRGCPRDCPTAWAWLLRLMQTKIAASSARAASCVKGVVSPHASNT